MFDNGYVQLAVAFSPTLLWWLFRPAPWKHAQERDGNVIFRVSTGWQIAGLIVLNFMLGAALFALPEDFSEEDWGASVVLLVFSWAGLWWFGQRVLITQEGIEKRSWWRSEILAWKDATRFLFLGNNRWMLVGAVGDIAPRQQVRIVLPRQYVDFDRLLQEIICRIPDPPLDEAPADTIPPDESGAASGPASDLVH